MKKIAKCAGYGCRIKERCQHYAAFLDDEGYEAPIRFIIPKEKCEKFMENDDK